MKLPYEVQEIMEVMTNGHRMPTYVVGGAVRDHVLGKEIRDYDMLVQLRGASVVSALVIIKNLALSIGFTIGIECCSELAGGGHIKLKRGALDVEIAVDGTMTLDQYIETFPVNVSKIYRTTVGRINQSKAFVEYVRFRKLIFNWENSGGTQEKQDAYELKIRRKFA
jgi:hypothetical protein